MAMPRQRLVLFGLAEKLSSLFPSIPCSRGRVDGLAKSEGGPGTLCHTWDWSLVLQLFYKVRVAMDRDFIPAGTSTSPGSSLNSSKEDLNTPAGAYPSTGEAGKCVPRTDARASFCVLGSVQQ